MKYSSSEKFEIIKLVEQSHLSAKQTLDKLGIPRSTFYRRYDLYQTDGVDALEDRCYHVFGTAFPMIFVSKFLIIALNEPELSPRKLAVKFTDQHHYFVSEASVYRLQRAHGLITSPAFIVMKAANEFRDKTTAPNQQH